jgi:hypothetical protein
MGMVVENSNDGADKSIPTKEIFLREEVFLRGIEGISSLMKHRDSKATIIDMKFSAIGFRSNTTILQAQCNTCSQSGLSGWVNPSSKSRLYDEPGTRRGRFEHKVRAYSLNDGIVCGKKALSCILGVIYQEVILHLYDVWHGTIH